MGAGLFVVSCPHCDAELQIDGLATATCRECGRFYLVRFGYLVPVDCARANASAASLAEP